ncbi:hypothetical protein CEXT_735661 [Caerostris extrusa]|uniref:Uncharacterized protein n=1 Tax=Caerostris extrusa TaxID=172846 RepID=A0AAV4VZH9_CAEEX|nr:hypothetical protein CEXT_735661 [Caerostris extrusa]
MSVLNRMKLMKRLGCISGCPCQLYVHPIFDYSKILITASNSVLSKLNITQNSAPAKSRVTELQTNIEHLSDHHDKLALFLREKLLRRDGFYWNNYKLLKRD